MAFSYHHFPLVSAVSWGTTVSAMLIYWVSIGRPQYPTQKSPIIPYMSDVGAFTFKPFFLVGCSVSSVNFLVSLWHIHSTWYSRTRLSWTASACSGIALFFGLSGAFAWVLQAIYDGFLHHARHLMLVHIFCGGVFFSAAFTSLTGHQIGTGADKPPSKAHVSDTVVVDAIVAAFCVLLLALLTLFLVGEGVIRGFLEWCLAFLLVAYLWMMKVYIELKQDGPVHLDPRSNGKVQKRA